MSRPLAAEVLEARRRGYLDQSTACRLADAIGIVIKVTKVEVLQARSLWVGVDISRTSMSR